MRGRGPVLLDSGKRGFLLERHLTVVVVVVRAAAAAASVIVVVVIVYNGQRKGQ